MKKNKAIISIVVGLVVFIGVFAAGYGWYLHNYGGQDYYTQITTKGKRISKDDNRYEYKQPAYNADGKQKIIEFNTGGITRPLKMNAYLKVSYNEGRQQVISWEKVAKAEIPDKAAAKLN